MKTVLLFTLCWIYVSAYHGWGPSQYSNRNKRDAVGSLDIVTNNAQAIHADVKPETATPVTPQKEIHGDVKPVQAQGASEKPCPGDKFVPEIDAGVVFKVLPPQDAIYAGQSGRKSLPHRTASALDIVRSVNRLVAVVVLGVTMAIEFYPMFVSLYEAIVAFMEM